MDATMILTIVFGGLSVALTILSIYLGVKYASMTATFKAKVREIYEASAFVVGQSNALVGQANGLSRGLDLGEDAGAAKSSERVQGEGRLQWKTIHAVLVQAGRWQASAHSLALSLRAFAEEYLGQEGLAPWPQVLGKFEGKESGG